MNVLETVVLNNLAVGLADARSNEVHAVDSGECKLAVKIVKKVRVLVYIDALVLYVDTTATGKSVLCIVAHIVGTSRLVDTEEV